LGRYFTLLNMQSGIIDTDFSTVPIKA
jgi:hypothetical protein